MLVETLTSICDTTDTSISFADDRNRFFWSLFSVLLLQSIYAAKQKKYKYNIQYTLFKINIPSANSNDNPETIKQEFFSCAHLLPCVVKRWAHCK